MIYRLLIKKDYASTSVIRRSLLPLLALTSSAKPGVILKGAHLPQLGFPQLLGQISKGKVVHLQPYGRCIEPNIGVTSQEINGSVYYGS
eukprot:SAG31_NODE_2043_length_6582_cov_2.798952_5_plen_89_part_00